MATSSEVVAKRRREVAWEAQMASLRAAEAAKPAAVAEPAPELTDEQKASEAGKLLRSRRSG